MAVTIDDLRRATRVLATLVRDEYPRGYSLSQIAATWPPEGLEDDDLIALRRVEDDLSRPVLHEVQRDVEEFHRALDIPIGETPAIRRPELRAALIEEEARETVTSIRLGDLVEAIDGLCDLLCVTYGAAIEFGIDLRPFWDEVHRTNMAKQGGPVREDGKRLKPGGWTPPDIAGILGRLVDA